MNRIASLQALRAAAALAVAMHHLSHEPYGLRAWTWLEHLPLTAGVDVFFVISGFVMVHASAGLAGTAGAWRVFMARRLARIVPLYWLTTTFFLLAAAAFPGSVRSGMPAWPEIVASYAFVPFQRASGAIQPVYSLGWTLNHEMFFYVLFALFLPLARVRGVACVALVLAGLVAAGRMFQPVHAAAIFWCDPIVLEFPLGMALALMKGRGLSLPGALRLVCAVLGLAALGLGETGWLPPPGFAPGAALVTAATVLGPEPRLPAFMARCFGHLGDASYALYLLHPFAFRSATSIWRVLAPESFVAGIVAGLVALALAMAIAQGSFRWVEGPATRRLGGRWRRPDGTAAAASG